LRKSSRTMTPPPAAIASGRYLTLAPDTGVDEERQAGALPQTLAACAVRPHDVDRQRMAAAVCSIGLRGYGRTRRP
jgi:hypothetical protein